MLQNLLRPFLKDREQKKFLLLLWNEVNANLERYLVIDQQEFVSQGFLADAWEQVKHIAGISLSVEVADYALVVEDFNRTLADCRTYETFYSSNVNNKNLENAQVLHAKKEVLAEKVKLVQPRIIAAQKALRVMLETVN